MTAIVDWLADHPEFFVVFWTVWILICCWLLWTGMGGRDA